MDALDPERYKLLKFFISKEGRWSPRAIVPEPGRNPGIDVVFPVLHGTFGEDGTVQGLLELADLPYVGAGVLGSSAAMDKDVAKRLCLQAGVPVVEYYIAYSADDAAKNPFGYPVFVKPANLGSSVGVSKARSQEELRTAIAQRTAVRLKDHRRARDRGHGAGMLRAGQRATGSVDAVRDPSFAGLLRLRRQVRARSRPSSGCPRRSSRSRWRNSGARQSRRTRRLPARAWREWISCSRSASGKLFVNEVNTIPGFTSISMYPKMWEHSGIPYPKLLDRLIELALERHARKQVAAIIRGNVLFAFALLLFFADESGGIARQCVEALRAGVRGGGAECGRPTESHRRLINGGAIPGMLRRLDPHSVFFDSGQFEQLKELERSTRKGFGSIVSILPGRVIVLQTCPARRPRGQDSAPAMRSSRSTGCGSTCWSWSNSFNCCTEARQHQVRIDVRRPGNARLLPLMLTPEDVESSSVDRAFLLQPGIGYVRASSFDVNTGKQIREAIEKLGGANLKGLVLDLRNNPGGVLQSAVDTVSLFLNPGQKIVSVRGRAVGGDEATVPKDAKPYKFPLSVLINGKSASASEIVAGAIEDQKRGKILGEQSFGKGLVQSVFPLSHGTGLALTTAYYYTPAGRSIQRPLQGQLERSTASGVGGITPGRGRLSGEHDAPAQRAGRHRGNHDVRNRLAAADTPSDRGYVRGNERFAG